MHMNIHVYIHVFMGVCAWMCWCFYKSLVNVSTNLLHFTNSIFWSACRFSKKIPAVYRTHRCSYLCGDGVLRCSLNLLLAHWRRENIASAVILFYEFCLHLEEPISRPIAPYLISNFLEYSGETFFLMLLLSILLSSLLKSW